MEEQQNENDVSPHETSQPLKLTLWEKCYLIALYGDIPRRARNRMFSVSSFPAQCGPYVMKHGYEFIGHFNDGRVAVRQRRRQWRAENERRQSHGTDEIT